MRIGVQMVFQSWGYGGRVTDAEVVADEVRLGELADELGFHALWPVEHHFDDYSFCPDNTVFLAHMAARTTRILLGTGAVILPWNDPLRVAEKIALLDHLSNGRVLFSPFPFSAVPDPLIVAMPTTPSKSVMVIGSLPAPGGNRWNTRVPGPKMRSPPGMCLGRVFLLPSARAELMRGPHRPDPAATPAATPAVRMNCRRFRPRSSSGGSG